MSRTTVDHQRKQKKLGLALYNFCVSFYREIGRCGVPMGPTGAVRLLWASSEARQTVLLRVTAWLNNDRSFLCVQLSTLLVDTASTHGEILATVNEQNSTGTHALTRLLAHKYLNDTEFHLSLYCRYRHRWRWRWRWRCFYRSLGPTCDCAIPFSRSLGSSCSF